MEIASSVQRPTASFGIGSQQQVRDASPAKKRARTADVDAIGAKHAGKSEDDQQLPICQHRELIVDTIASNQVVILVGETGSGKTTQVPRFLHEVGLTNRGVVVVTQPRRVAAISIANRVASEMGCEVGGTVGFHVRFQNRTSEATRIKYVTDGMLLRECAGERGIRGCCVVIFDEAHERSINTDVLLGLAKRALDQKDPPNLKIVVMSATMNALPFVDFFGGPKQVKLLMVPGRTFQVKIFYTPTPEPDFLEAAMIAVLQIHLWGDAGDVLVFLPGQEDIDGLHRLLEEKRALLADRRREFPKEPVWSPVCGEGAAVWAAKPVPIAEKVDDFVVRPIFAALPFDQQELVFQPAPAGCRKVVLATNIAETSITIPGIRYVVDAGLMKLKICHPQTGVEALRLVETSRASASQRAGRAGREAPGEVYRLYVEAEYEKMPAQTPAEILRCEMSSVYLQLKALGISRVSALPLVDRPPPEALVKAAHFLCRIGALDRGDELTQIGHKLAALPIHPLYAYCLYVAVEFECMAEMLSIVAMLSTETPFFVGTKRNEVARESKSSLHEDGDHLSLLSMYSQWRKVSANQRQSFARLHGLNHSALERAATIRAQLKDLVQTAWGVTQITSCGGPKNWIVVRRCLLKGCFTQTARLDELNRSCYQTLLSRQSARLHPSSALFRKRPEPSCVVYSELVTTTRNYLRIVTEVDPLWLVELCPQHFAASNTG